MHIPQKHTSLPTPPFWGQLRSHGAAVALLDPQLQKSSSYSELAVQVDALVPSLRKACKKLVFLFGENDIGTVVCYLSNLVAGNATFIAPVRIDHPGAKALIESFQPDLVLWRNGHPSCLGQHYKATDPFADYNAAQRIEPSDKPIDPQLALLLATSGSTGNTKLVRLSFEAVRTSAAQVVNALNIGLEDRAVAALPFSYVYGLSVLHSHLSAGASILLERHRVAESAFWADLKAMRATSYAGVSTTFKLMQTRKIDIHTVPTLRSMTHAGGPLDRTLHSWLLSQFRCHGVKVFSMYGQTEASGRIAVLPPELFADQPASVGFPVPHGTIDISEDQEIVYTGPNVMLGYARSRDDLCLGDGLNGVLRTGDLGYKDSNGLLYVTGRRNRICKVLGRRINLDELETYFGKISEVAVIGEDDGIIVFCCDHGDEIRALTRELFTHFQIPPQFWHTQLVESLPRTSSGKIAYGQLIGG